MRPHELGTWMPSIVVALGDGRLSLGGPVQVCGSAVTTHCSGSTTRSDPLRRHTSKAGRKRSTGLRHQAITLTLGERELPPRPQANAHTRHAMTTRTTVACPRAMPPRRRVESNRAGGQWTTDHQPGGTSPFTGSWRRRVPRRALRRGRIGRAGRRVRPPEWHARGVPSARARSRQPPRHTPARRGAGRGSAPAARPPRARARPNVVLRFDRAGSVPVAVRNNGASGSLADELGEVRDQDVVPVAQVATPSGSTRESSEDRCGPCLTRYVEHCAAPARSRVTLVEIEVAHESRPSVHPDAAPTTPPRAPVPGSGAGIASATTAT